MAGQPGCILEYKKQACPNRCWKRKQASDIGRCPEHWGQLLLVCVLIILSCLRQLSLALQKRPQALSSQRAAAQRQRNPVAHERIDESRRITGPQGKWVFGFLFVLWAVVFGIGLQFVPHEGANSPYGGLGLIALFTGFFIMMGFLWSVIGE